ncbi:hypothetical protein C5167_042752 [Papaver somniferum]|uniref:Uncharacterized protein n=1 Tax=Papaver somniferum TaxID=3469 RepID=A0A4Y7L5G4_PAPSO|nr:hypothetical protein C5167_042752 [Papaver somniferum]
MHLSTTIEPTGMARSEKGGNSFAQMLYKILINDREEEAIKKFLEHVHCVVYLDFDEWVHHVP